MTSRVFIAMEIPTDVLDKIISFRNKNINCESNCGGNNLKWEPKEKLHVTLKFIGDITKDEVQKVKSALTNALTDIKSIKMAFTKFGFFYGNNNPRILYLGLKENNEIKFIYKKIEDELAELGFVRGRKYFKPHLTLLRIKDGRGVDMLKEFAKIEPLSTSFNIDKIILFKSELLPSGSKYSVIENYKLI